MTTIDLPTTELVAVTFDLYRDIHKAIRAELFGVTAEAASLDPADAIGRAALRAHVHDVVELLASHSEHEDAAIQPVLEVELPDLAKKVEDDHRSIEARIAGLDDLAVAVAAPRLPDAGHQVHRLHLALAAFTGDYLAHQDVEERVIMPALEASVGVEAVIGLHKAILASIPPAEMAQSLALMLPAMNVDGRIGLLAGMRAEAPAEAFEQVWSLARSVLAPADFAAVASGLGLR